MDSTIIARARYWSESDAFDAETRQEVKALLDEGNERQLTDRFYRDLEFGTGGMRGIMGAGTAMMNIYNIRKASMALGQYLRSIYGDGEAIKIAISHDSRLMGRRFAEGACEVFAALGIKTLITKDMRPVPMLSFMVRHFHCHAGVCVTASHNPPEYNGYKVYWQTGGQLVPPHDKKIVDLYGKITRYDEIPRMEFGDALTAGLVEEVGQSLDDAYFAKVKSLSLRSEGRRGFKIVYTPIHGTGIFAVPEVLRQYGFENITIVPEQRDPDGHFPTVRSPNPEDPAALAMALDLAKKENADIVLATDPDSDRIAIITREKDDFIWFNGNQLGCLLIDYVLGSMKESGKLTDHDVVIKSIVTTEMQRKIAKSYGVDCVDTLTGFKWICHLIEEFENKSRVPYKRFVCGGEESYGFLMGDFVRDKDAVIGCAIASEMVAWNKSKGRSMSEVLDQLFRAHNVFHETLHTETLPGKEGAEKIRQKMMNLRANPPKKIAGLPVAAIDDFEMGERREFTAGGGSIVKKLAFPKSDVLQFSFGSATRASVRPSGTEPKIKFYVSVEEPSQGFSGAALEKAKERAKIQAKSIELALIDLVR